MKSVDLYVVRVSDQHAALYERKRWFEGDSAYRIVPAPDPGDLVLDRICVRLFTHQGVWRVAAESAKNWENDVSVSIRAAIAHETLDQEEAEYDLSAVLSALFYNREESPNYVVATAEGPVQLCWRCEQIKDCNPPACVCDLPYLPPRTQREQVG